MTTLKKLGVNIDHIATIKKLRDTDYPDLIEAVHHITEAGAHSITVHLREDRRHINENDIIQLKKAITLPLNLEIQPTAEMLNFALQVKPAVCCLLTEQRNESTTNGGLNVAADTATVAAAVKRLAAAGILVSLFIEPDPLQIAAAKKTGAAAVELYTGHYAHARTTEAQAEHVGVLKHAAETAAELGLQVDAGHGLNYLNTQTIAALPEISVFNIGHAIIARAVLVGLKQAVQEMLAIIL